MSHLKIFTFPFKTSYYFKHPIIFITDFIRNVRWAYQRITKGYCESDLWNMDWWFLEIFPAMLREFINNADGYPGYDPYDTPEKWDDKINAIADVLESLKEENWYKDSIVITEEEVLKRRKLITDTFKEISYIFDNLWD